jgi:glycosyltransferase involved in cell wall biosynthesis
MEPTMADTAQTDPAVRPVPPVGSRAPQLDVDFSLAMHNRTGKYFIGKDLLECNLPMLGDVYYWALRRADPPEGLAAKVICKIQGLIVRANAASGFARGVTRRRPPRPLLHLEPYTVLSAKLRPFDVVVCHDLGPITHPELFETRLYPAYRRIFAELARVGPHLIFDSIASQRAFEDLYPDAQPASKRVLYPAIRSDAMNGAQESVEGLTGRFLLTVGAIGDRKNQRRCIEAFARSGLAGQGVSYVICGSREPGYDAVAELARSVPGVIILPYVADRQLRWLYRNAAGFVLVSLLEGFGIPLAEAMSEGLVPMVTRDSVLDAVDTAEIASVMGRLADMPDAERHQRLVALRKSIERFSLEKFRNDWRGALGEIVALNGHVSQPA